MKILETRPCSKRASPNGC